MCVNRPSCVGVSRISLAALIRRIMHLNTTRLGVNSRQAAAAWCLGQSKASQLELLERFFAAPVTTEAIVLDQQKPL